MAEDQRGAKCQIQEGFLGRRESAGGVITQRVFITILVFALPARSKGEILRNGNITKSAFIKASKQSRVGLSMLMDKGVAENMAENIEQLLRESKHIDACRGPGVLPPLIETPFFFNGKRVFEIETEENKGDGKNNSKKES